MRQLVSHPFGDLLAQHLHRKHGLSQSKLAAGILQSPSVITAMCQGKRLQGRQARERVRAIIGWLQQQGALTTLDEANALLNAAGMSPLSAQVAHEATLIHHISAQAPQQYHSLTARSISPRSASVLPRHNLPAQLTPFIGRTEQIAQLVAQLQRRRLLTLTGAGGAGKTRLALEVAGRLLANFGDGVWFVDLAPLTDAEALPQRILDLWRVAQQPDRSPQESLLAYLSAQQTMLILDNCEHLISACANLAEVLLQHCPQLVLLATSREALNLQPELPWRVPSLTRPLINPGWPDLASSVQSPLTPAALIHFEAVALFCERARSHQPSFALTLANAPSVAQICSRLDGIPLALEMAAARLHIFTVEELAIRLDSAFDRRFQLLTGARTAPLRHQTLRALLEWSYDLLTPSEQRLLVHLAVFYDGWSAAAAEAVTGCALDLLAQLVNKSLVIADQQAGQSRYRLLETVRQFALELATGDEQAQRQVQWQHSHYYLGLLGEQQERLQCQTQRVALDLLRRDFANISAAWQWAVAQQEFVLLAPAVHALFLFCDVLGNYRIGIPLFAQAVAELAAALAGPMPFPPTRHLLLGQLHARLGACQVMVSDFAQGEQYLHASLRAATTAQEHALALLYLGIAAAVQGELAGAITHLQASLASSRRSNDSAGMADALHYTHLTITADYPYACRLCTESLVLWRSVGRPDRVAQVLNFLAYFTWCAGDYATASAYWREGLALCEQLELWHEKAWVLECMGFGAWGLGEWAVATQMIEDALTIYTTLGIQSMVGMCLADLALVLAGSGQVEQAIVRGKAAVGVTRAVNNQMMLTHSLNCLGAALLAADELAQARYTLRAAIEQAWTHHYVYHLMIGFYYFADLLVRESDAEPIPNALAPRALAIT